MRLHTRLTTRELQRAILRAKNRGLIAPDVDFAVFEYLGPSRTHARSFEIQLGTHDRDSLPAGYTDQNGHALRVRRARWNSSRGDARYAATWHEWGWFIAEIFAADRRSRWGNDPARSRHPWGYFSPADFHEKTGGQFRRLHRPVIDLAVAEPRRLPVTEALRAQGDLALGAPGWRTVRGAQVEDIRAGDLIRVQPVLEPEAEYAIAAVPDPEIGHLDDYLYPRLVTCSGEEIRVAVACRITVLRYSARAGTLRQGREYV